MHNQVIDLTIRLSVLKTHLGLNWEQLAAELGTSRQTLNNARNAKVGRSLSQPVMDKIAELEQAAGISQIANTRSESACKTMAEYRVDCARCREKDAEIAHLRQLLKTADGNLAKAQDNLSGMIELMQTKKECAIPASGACYKPGKPNSKKGA